MIILVRVDDRLLHGQIICAWVPFMKADALLVASDEAAGDALASEIIESCGCAGLNVYVKKIKETASCIGSRPLKNKRVILIVGDLKDAMRVYEEGFRFSELNLGNVHHEENGRKITSSVFVNSEDEEIIERFESLGVSIEIRDVPAGIPAPFAPFRKKPC